MILFLCDNIIVCVSVVLGSAKKGNDTYDILCGKHKHVTRRDTIDSIMIYREIRAHNKSTLLLLAD